MSAGADTIDVLDLSKLTRDESAQALEVWEGNGYSLAGLDGRLRVVGLSVTWRWDGRGVDARRTLVFARANRNDNHATR